MAAAVGTNLTVFPGVEITCDSSKLHLLVLFDPSKSSAEVGDFLVKADIRRDDFGKQEASTIKSVFEIIELATSEGAIVIPAHIDEYNGLGKLGVQNIKTLFKDFPVLGVQVVHKEFLNPTLQTNSNAELKEHLNDYYGKPRPAIDDATIKEWFTPVKYALDAQKAILTFSDNPHGPKNSKHGLAGIGSRFTWIKMDEKPSLEGLRQALLLHKIRVKNDFISPLSPFRKPTLWFKSVTVTNSEITEPSQPFRIDFSPQLTTIIGGRGSGKSSVLRFIRGVFNRTADIGALADILGDHKDFYRREDPVSHKGVLNGATTVEIEFVRNDLLYRITASQIVSSTIQTVKIERQDGTSGWIEENAEGFIDFFQYEQYSQKQIFEIAQEPNSFRERIDNSIYEMVMLKEQRDGLQTLYLEKCASIRSIKQQLAGKGRLQTEIADLADRMNALQQSGISTLLSTKEKFSLEQRRIDSFIAGLKGTEDALGSFIGSLPQTGIDLASFELDHSTDLSSAQNKVIGGYNAILSEMEALKGRLETLRNDYESEVAASSWKRSMNANGVAVEEKKGELEGQGIDDISNFENLSQERNRKEGLLGVLIETEGRLVIQESEKADIHRQYIRICRSITEHRRRFASEKLADEKVSVSINQFRNRADFVAKLRRIIQRQNSTYQGDIDALTQMCFATDVESGLRNVRNAFHVVKAGESVEGISGTFANLIAGMNDSQIDEIDLLVPEDEIFIKYKPSGSNTFRPLSTASAGQKTTAILTLILSQGDIPLILDQPEDDLDNRLVYELIVDRLKNAKEHRQLIIVTHNANIPINGDAEYVVSLDSESTKMRVFEAGTVEFMSIKKEICDVMEGTEPAFDMRYQRYKQIGML